MVRRSILIWLVIMILAIANGALREMIFTPEFGAQAGHVISTILLCCIILLVTWLSIHWVGPDGPKRAWRIGIIWLLLTLSFEFLAGHYLFGNSWEMLLEDYNLARGRIWPLVLLTTLFSPVWMYRVRITKAE